MPRHRCRPLGRLPMSLAATVYSCNDRLKLHFTCGALV
jgi:hypothetical protein